MQNILDDVKRKRYVSHMSTRTYHDIVKEARQRAGLGRGSDALTTRLEREGRISFGVISREVIRDKADREEAIVAMVEAGLAVVEVEVNQTGRPTTWLVKS